MAAPINKYGFVINLWSIVLNDFSGFNVFFFFFQDVIDVGGVLKCLDRNRNFLEHVGLHLTPILLDVWILWVVLLVVWSLWPPNGAVKVIWGLRLVREEMVLGKREISEMCWHIFDCCGGGMIWVGRWTGAGDFIFFFLGSCWEGVLTFGLWFFRMFLIPLFHLRVPTIPSSFEVHWHVHFFLQRCFLFFPLVDDDFAL